MRTKLIYGAAFAALAMAAATSAAAQSTGSQEVEEVVVTGERKSIDGVIGAEKAAKSRATITQDYLQTQQPGQTVLQSLNLMPSVNYTNQDAYGVSGGDLTIRGFDAQRISLNVDGIQLNDTGNYQIYGNQQLDPELIDRASVNLGTTDVDSPTASATGGTVNYITRKPSSEAGLMLSPAFGTDAYHRVFGMVETGEVGPFGTTAWFSASYTAHDKFRGVGDLQKKQYNARIYQDLGDGDFMSVAFHWNENRNNTYKPLNVDRFNAGTVDLDNDDVCALVPGGAGRQDDGTTCGNYFGFFHNPSNTGNIRGQSRFSLSDNLVLTVDPTFQYVLANGGGTTLVDEFDQRLQGSFYDNTDATTRRAHGVDLNRDGDIEDRVRLYSPSNTNTRRYSVNSSLIWDLTEDHRVRFAYTWDRGSHRQTGEYSTMTAGGDPTNVFSGKDGNGQAVLTLDGDVFQKRNRHSIATLNQFAVEYVGQFGEDVTVSLGLRAPFFKRDLSNYCYQQNTFDAFCSAQAPRNTSTGAAIAAGAPVKFNREYNDVLPNVGATWNFAENQSVYVNYSENLSAPRTDDLYDKEPANPEPETSRNFDVGYRWQSDRLFASGSVFYSKFDNYILRALTVLDSGETLATSINVGEVNRWGFDGQVGFEATDALTLYASASYLGSEVQQDTPNSSSSGAPWATKGKEMPEVPEWQFAARGEYEIAGFTLGLQGKYVDERWTNLINDEKTDAYVVVDADVRYDLDFVNDDTFLQLNVQNLFDEEYLGNISTEISGNRTAQLGAPRSVVLSLTTRF